jgi:hypothetical protein
MPSNTTCPYASACGGCPFGEIFLGSHVCYLPAMVLRGYHDVIRYLRDVKGFTIDMIDTLRVEAQQQGYKRTLETFDEYFLGNLVDA